MLLNFISVAGQLLVVNCQNPKMIVAPPPATEEVEFKVDRPGPSGKSKC